MLGGVVGNQIVYDAAPAELLDLDQRHIRPVQNRLRLGVVRRSIRRRESGRWQIRYRTRDGVRVAWPETYARRADAVRVLAELERQSQVAGNWLDVAGSKVRRLRR